MNKVKALTASFTLIGVCHVDSQTCWVNKIIENIFNIFFERESMKTWYQKFELEFVPQHNFPFCYDWHFGWYNLMLVAQFHLNFFTQTFLLDLLILLQSSKSSKIIHSWKFHGHESFNSSWISNYFHHKLLHLYLISNVAPLKALISMNSLIHFHFQWKRISSTCSTVGFSIALCAVEVSLLLFKKLFSQWFSLHGV